MTRRTATQRCLDRDGFVDLFVAHWAVQHPGDPANLDRLFRNDGDGMFSDVTSTCGIADGGDAALLRPCLAAIGAHLDQDLWPDIYTGNVIEDHMLKFTSIAEN